MKLPLIPNGVKTFINLWPALRAVYEGIEHGAGRVVEFFETEKDYVEPFLAPDLVRYHARRFIQVRLGQIDVTMEKVPNISLRMRFKDHQLWIMKTPDGDLPAPRSLIKEDFYSQNLPLLVTDPTQIPSPNLAVLWQAPRSYNMVSLKLVCPRSGDMTTAFTDHYWKQRIPHPAELMGFNMPEDADAATQEELSAIEKIIFRKAQDE